MSEQISVIDENTLEVTKTTQEVKTYVKSDLEVRLSEIEAQIQDLTNEKTKIETLLGQFNGNK